MSMASVNPISAPSSTPSMVDFSPPAPPDQARADLKGHAAVYQSSREQYGVTATSGSKASSATYTGLEALRPGG